ncbi:MAG: hypothetical protein DMG53_29145 [Acidobacteria bacterium]|nr:MAG: hypothetical protein DMG53_29145 [Acidobacteriota bacterium]
MSTPKTAALALITVGLMVGYAQPITAQGGMSGDPMDMREAVPPEKLPPPLKLTGIGNAHIPITATPEAQMWFDQGLNLLHDFWDYESVRAFEQSVRVDPQCAMCYWGIYRAAKTNYRAANKYFRDQALTKAVSLKGTTMTASRAPGKNKRWRFSKPSSRRTPTTLPRITTGFTPSKQVRTLSKPCTAQKFSAAWPPPQDTWCTCPATSFIASATTPARGNPLRHP